MITAFIVFLLVSVLYANLPPSQSRLVASKVFGPVLRHTGLTQGWNLFAPEPLGRSLRFVAVVRFADGTIDTWTPPTRDRFIGVYRDYRWLGMGYFAQPDKQLWQSLGRWVAEHLESRRGVAAGEVSFYRAVAAIPPPGSYERPKWTLQRFETVDLRGEPRKSDR